MVKNPNDWKNVAEKGLNFLDLISSYDLLDLIFGDWFWRSSDIIIKVLSVIGGIYSSYQLFLLVKEKYFNRKTVILIDRNSFMREQRQAMLNEETEFKFNNAFYVHNDKYDYDDNIFKKMNI